MRRLPIRTPHLALAPQHDQRPGAKFDNAIGAGLGAIAIAFHDTTFG